MTFSKNIADMKSEVLAHIAADAVIQGDYWSTSENAVGGKGCFIGCLTHSDSSNAEYITKRFGIPTAVLRIAERIFEQSPEDQAIRFFEEFPEAIGRDGKDLSRVHWLFLADILRHLPDQTGEIKELVNKTIAGIDLLCQGKAWKNAADFAMNAKVLAAASSHSDVVYAAAYAATAAAAAITGHENENLTCAAYNCAAASACNAAASAFNATAFACNAAVNIADGGSYSAEVARQRDNLLRILRDAE